MGFPGGASGNESAGQCRRHGFDPWVRKIPWKRAWQPTPVFLLGEPHGQRSQTGHKELGMTDTPTWQNNIYSQRNIFQQGSFAF